MSESRLQSLILQLEQDGFSETALQIYREQSRRNPILREFHRLLGHDAESVRELKQIRFLPISFFKSHRVISENKNPVIEFSSSTTTGSVPSIHPVADLGLYEEVFLDIFSRRYGQPEDLSIMALLPSYLERKGSSLVYMVDKLIRKSHSPFSGFFLNNHQELASSIRKAKEAGNKIILFTVTFALLELAREEFNLEDVLVIETGGMKGRGKELTREELVEYVSRLCRPAGIDSEYGMTELLSQAYSSENGLLQSPSWMRILVRASDDPFHMTDYGRGLLNIIDLANLDSCSFIASDDLVLSTEEGFRIMGRADHSEIRGCNLLVAG
jgi:hypothetical protein